MVFRLFNGNRKMFNQVIMKSNFLLVQSGKRVVVLALKVNRQLIHLRVLYRQRLH